MTHGWGSGELKRGGRKGDSEDYSKKKIRGVAVHFLGVVSSVKLQLLFKSFQRARFRPCVCQSSPSSNCMKLYQIRSFVTENLRKYSKIIFKIIKRSNDEN